MVVVAAAMVEVMMMMMILKVAVVVVVVASDSGGSRAGAEVVEVQVLNVLTAVGICSRSLAPFLLLQLHGVHLGTNIILATHLVDRLDPTSEEKDALWAHMRRCRIT